jgi:4-amino-4-deoxy-L-arabinose transferase-like glycosyltransferase
MKKNDSPARFGSSALENGPLKKATILALLAAVLVVRLVYLGLFHDRLFSGPSTQFEQAFAAMGLLEGKGVTTFAEPPVVVAADDPDRFVDPEQYQISNSARISYIKEVPGYGFFLAALWKIFGAKTWLAAQIVQLLLELLAAWGIYRLALRAFGGRAAFWAVLIFAFLFHEARASVIPYKDIVLLYVMLGIAFLAVRVFEGRGRPWIPFAGLCALTGLGYYFMPNILLYPFFLIAAFLVLKKIKIRTAAALAVLAAVIVGSAVLPYQAHVRAHRAEPGVTAPLFWYRFWLGSQVRAFYSTEEERFQDFLRERITATGKSLEDVCKDEFLAGVKANPLGYAAKTVKKLLYGTFLVYGNGGDASYSTSFSKYKSDNPRAGFFDYAKSRPVRILGMILGTLSASILFPLSLVGVFLLFRAKKTALAFFFLQIPLYYILLHMFFHYEARYLVGTLPGYLPLVGFVFARAAGRWGGRNSLKSRLPA